MKTKDTEVLGRELNLARSKPDTVDRPVRTARIFVQLVSLTKHERAVNSTDRLLTQPVICLLTNSPYVLQFMTIILILVTAQYTIHNK